CLRKTPQEPVANDDRRSGEVRRRIPNSLEGFDRPPLCWLTRVQEHQGVPQADQLCASFPDEIAPLESLIRITSPHLEGRSSEIEVPLLESRFGHRPESHRVQELLTGLQPVAPSHLFHRQG